MDLETLVSPHIEGMLRYARSRMSKKLSSRVDEYDIVQEVLIKASKKLEKFLKIPDGDFRIWIYGLVRDEIVNAYRIHVVSQRRTVDKENFYYERVDSDSEDNFFTLVDKKLNPAQKCLLKEERKMAMSALSWLNEQDFKLVYLKFIKNLTHEEISKELDVPKLRIAMRLERAIKKVKKRIRHLPFYKEYFNE